MKLSYEYFIHCKKWLSLAGGAGLHVSTLMHLLILNAEYEQLTELLDTFVNIQRLLKKIRLLFSITLNPSSHKTEYFSACQSNPHSTACLLVHYST